MAPAGQFFAIGSHSARRRNITREKDRNKSLEQIRERFEVKSPDREKDREALVRFQIDPGSGQLVPDSLASISLRLSFEQDLVLKHFVDRPSKENGIDIEGIASDGERLYLGFRGPVLRHGFTPVLVLKANPSGSPVDTSSLERRYVSLDGLGIRDMTRAGNGFLVLAGPAGDLLDPYRLYFWDGNDCLPGKRESGQRPVGKTTYLGEIPSAAGAKAEALSLLDQMSDGFWKILVLYDGIAGGGPMRFRVSQPGRLSAS